MSADTPKPTKDTVYVDAEDEITAIIDKIDATKNKVVAVVLPKRAPTLKSIVNMRLLKRSAENAGKSVVLITEEDSLLPLAGAAGIYVAKDLKSKPEIPSSPIGEKNEADDEPTTPKDDLDGKKTIGELAVAHKVLENESIDLDNEDEDDKTDKKDKKAKPPKDKKLKVPNFDRFRLGLTSTVVLAVVFVVLIILGFFVWPKATITIQTESIPVSANFNLDATDKVKALDEASAAMPSTLKTQDQTGSSSVPATGQQNNGTKATGSVTMTICATSPGQLSDVPAGTGVSTNGLTYITQQNAAFSFMGACGSNFKFQSNSVAITAQQPGAKYNTSLNGAAVSNSSATASGSASGGTDSIVTVVSQADVDNGKAKAISPQSASDFSKNFTTQLQNQGFYVISSTLKAGDPQVTATPAVGQPASTTSVTVKITYSVLVVKKSDLQQAIMSQLNKQINTKKQKVSSNDIVKDATITVQSQSSPNEANLQVSISTTSIPILDESAIKAQSEGQKGGDIENFINNYPGVKGVIVKMSPFWVSKAPKKPAKIHIILQPVKS